MAGKCTSASECTANWFEPKSYPRVPYIANLLMDPSEKMTPDSDEFGYIGRLFFAQKFWAPTGAVPPGPSQEPGRFSTQSGCGHTLSMKKAVDEAMKKLQNPSSRAIETDARIHTAHSSTAAPAVATLLTTSPEERRVRCGGSSLVPAPYRWTRSVSLARSRPWQSARGRCQLARVDPSLRRRD